MEVRTPSWDDIPSLKDLEVDWNYKPDNPLGQRKFARIIKKNLHFLVDAPEIPVRIICLRNSYTAKLEDLSSEGLAVILDKSLREGQPVKLGFFLGKHKILSKATVRNIRSHEGSYRIGLEFIDPRIEDRNFITELIPSQLYKNEKIRAHD